MNKIEDISNSKTKFIRVVWCDNANIIRGKAVHIDTIQDEDISVGISRGQQGVPVMYDGVVDGSGLDPVGEIILKGDLSTLTQIPYAPGHARMMGDMIKNGTPWKNCPRGFLKRMINKARDDGLEIRVAFENEFYLLKTDDVNGEIEPSDSTPFASTYSMDLNHEIIEEIVESLTDQNITVEQYYPESGPGQHEITIKYTDALKAADNQIIFRETVKAIAHKHGLLASFLPKIFPDTAGSGCHVHMSLWKEGLNILHDSEEDYDLSETAKEFIGGILHHLPSLMAITTPIPNSHSRIHPQMWTGAFQVWGLNNREAAIRVIKTDNQDITHFEVKPVDASSNPYLALGAVIATGLDGVRKKIELPRPIQKDPATLSSVEMDKLGVKLLPNDMKETLLNLKKDETILGAMGPELSKSYLAVKNVEYEELSKLSLKKEVNLLLEKY